MEDPAVSPGCRQGDGGPHRCTPWPGVASRRSRDERPCLRSVQASPNGRGARDAHGASKVDRNGPTGVDGQTPRRDRAASLAAVSRAIGHRGRRGLTQRHCRCRCNACRAGSWPNSDGGNARPSWARRVSGADVALERGVERRNAAAVAGRTVLRWGWSCQGRGPHAQSRFLAVLACKGVCGNDRHPKGRDAQRLGCARGAGERDPTSGRGRLNRP